MLQTLSIRNFAIIDRIDLDFSSGFTVLTGETGSGKSIVIDALAAVLGGRVGGDQVRAGSESANIEAIFDISKHTAIQERIAARDLQGDDADCLLIRRVVGAKGKGRVSINDHVSTLGTLQEIVGGLVEICGQHEHHSLLMEDRHRVLLDAAASHGEMLVHMREAYTAWRAAESAYEAFNSRAHDVSTRREMIHLVLADIDRVAPVLGEMDALDAERGRLAHADKLKRGASVIESLLYGDDGAIYDVLARAESELNALVEIDAELGVYLGSLQSVSREVEEIARALARYAHVTESDPNRLEALELRTGELRRLCRKYGGELHDVIAKRETLADELRDLEQPEARREVLDTERQMARVHAEGIARGLSRSRRGACKKLDTLVQRELSEMELGKAVFRTEVHVRADDDLTPHGMDDVRFYWTANPGEPEKPLVRIASGGELSRLMLAIKTVLSGQDLVAVYIFDEVDSGIGGKAADSIGRKIHKVAEQSQAIVITHLAPVAARADHHLCVTKTEEGGRTLSRVEYLQGEMRTEELARMIDGNTGNRATKAAAKAMLARG